MGSRLLNMTGELTYRRHLCPANLDRDLSKQRNVAVNMRHTSFDFFGGLRI
jgi:hypothetical protein